jgi:hypothetical protein
MLNSFGGIMDDRTTYLISLVGYYVLVVVAIGLSTYLTYYGFVRSVPTLAIPIAAVVGIVLFVVDISIQRYRENGKSIILPLAVFILPALISGASNFNTVYTAFMQGDVSRATLTEQYGIFRDDLVATQSALANDPTISREIVERDEIEALLQNLWTQCTDPGRPGCGQRARDLIQQINSRLERPVTDLAFPGGGSTADQIRPVFQNFSNLVYENKDSEASSEAYVEYRNLASFIDESLAKFRDIDFDVDITEARVLLSEMSEISKEVERRANPLLPANQVREHSELDPEAGKLGEIIYTVKNGLFDVPNLSATIFALFIALFVDFMPIIVAFLVNYKDIRPDFPEVQDPYLDI